MKLEAPSSPSAVAVPNRIEGWAKVTGQALYADDVAWPNMAYGYLVRSPHAHARIVSVDLEAARSMPGVLAVLAGPGSTAPYGIMPSNQDEHALATGKVTYFGEPLVAIAAETLRTARAAARAVRVAYEPLAPVLKTGPQQKAAPQVREDAGDGNLHKAVDLEFGDVAAGLREAQFTRTDEFFFQGNNHLALEPHAVTAFWQPDGQLVLESSTQVPHYVQRSLARALGLPEHQIRVMVPTLGGGFGGKSELFPHEVAAALLSRSCGRPVRITLSREDVFYTHRGRHPVEMKVATGFDRQHRLEAMSFESRLDGGAYSSYGIASTYYTGALQPTTYQIGAYRFHGERWFTTKPPCGPKRGHGTTQPRALLEVHMDRVARDLGLDPIDLRREILQPPFSVTVNQLDITTSGLAECLDAVERMSGWKERRGRLGKGRGLGFACSSYLSGAGLPIYWNPLPHSGARIAIGRDGGVQVACGITDIGQGANTVLAILAARSLGVALGRVRVTSADTGTTPVDLGSYSSRVTLMAGNALLTAAERMLDLLRQAAARHWQVPAQEIARDGEDFAVLGRDERAAWTEVARWAEAEFGPLVTAGGYTPAPPRGRHKGSGVGPSPAYSFSACIAEVEVDELDGRLQVQRLYVAHDPGTPLNPQSVEGQIRGGVVMGLGEVLMEAQAFNPDGRHRGPHLLGYRIPTMLDVPEISIAVVGQPDPNGPLGAKEVGQGPLNPVIPAVLNAVQDAVGIELHETPATPDRILRALDAKRRRGNAR